MDILGDTKKPDGFVMEILGRHFAFPLFPPFLQEESVFLIIVFGN
jgi:hypothetical protein